MAMQFDVSTKHLFEAYPAAWLAYAGLPSVGPMAVVDADLSAVLAEADKVLRLEAPVPLCAGNGRAVAERSTGHA